MKKIITIFSLMILLSSFLLPNIYANYKVKTDPHWYYNFSRELEENDYKAEFINAYRYAYDKWITSASSISDANMDWSITRIEMAKMISIYALKVLWLKADTSKNCNFDDVSREMDTKYWYWVTRACQLWLMWYNNDWKKTANFNPKKKVNRWQLATVLSRMLNQAHWTKIENWNPYYDTHLNYLIKKWIINNYYKPTPDSNEKRWNVMLMLYRADEKNYVTVNYEKWKTRVPAWKIYINEYYWFWLISASITDTVFEIYEGQNWVDSTWMYLKVSTYLPEKIDDYKLFDDEYTKPKENQDKQWYLTSLAYIEIIKNGTENMDNLIDWRNDVTKPEDIVNKKWYYLFHDIWCCIQESPYETIKDTWEYSGCPMCWPMWYFYNYDIFDL